MILCPALDFKKKVKIRSGTSTLFVSDDETILMEDTTFGIHYQDMKFVYVSEVNEWNNSITFFFYQKNKKGEMCYDSMECSNAAVVSYLYSMLEGKNINKNRDCIVTNQITNSSWILKYINGNNKGHLVSISKCLLMDTIKKHRVYHCNDIYDNIENVRVDITSGNKICLIDIGSFLSETGSMERLKEILLRLALDKLGYKIIAFLREDNFFHCLLCYNGDFHRSFPVSSLYIISCYLEYFGMKLERKKYICRNMESHIELPFELREEGMEILFSSQITTNLLEDD
ncbi:hypothetical protein [Photorhabdus sp. CRCIA-P01]|uniref:hypothetical protein n=1 Tax=Photorhabdus sp. CRCIA-P01 TaxID=2019570 RepID=UPI000E59E0B2|nr:hypothetical protein [Photorhabdus sp. CRCIA-P01]